MPPNQAIQWFQQHVRITAVVTVLLLAALLAVLVFLAAIGPTADKPFTGFTSVKCTYNGQAVVFLDNDGDGVQQADEPGIAGVKLTVKHMVPLYLDNGTPQVRVSDATGHITFDSDRNCSVGDTLIISFTLPDGYSAVTPLTFGPYAIPNLTTEQPGTPLLTIPSVISVGLRQK